eukprot:13074928-Ditylum_brightwellii.AAC.1
MKEECAKMKNDLDDGKDYGDGTKTNIDGKAKEVIDKTTEQYSPIGGIDATKVLAKIVSNPIMDVADVEAELAE